MRDLPTVPAGEDVPAPDAASHQVASAHLMATLAVAGALAGLVIVLVFGWADPRIQAHRAAALREAVHEVLSAPASYRSVYVTEDGLSDTPTPGTDTVTADKVFLGFDGSDAPVGYAITGAEPGYQDLIRLIFGYDPAAGRLLGMKVLESKETPGLGDKIFKDLDFVAGFEGVEAPIVGVKPGAATGAANEVDMITGATISSRTVIEIINHRLEALGTALEAHAESAPRPAAAPQADSTSVRSDPALPDEASRGGEEGS